MQWDATVCNKQQKLKWKNKHIFAFDNYILDTHTFYNTNERSKAWTHTKIIIFILGKWKTIISLYLT